MPSEKAVDFIKHYADQYYDPVKAKAYYDRTKQLKGRQPALSKNQNSVLTVAKSNISASRKADLAKLDSAHKAQVAKLKANAEAQVKQIEAKLKAFFDSQAKKTIAIPVNASPKMRALLEKSNKQILAKNVETSNKARQAVGNQLRSAVAAAQKSYAASHNATVAKYNTAAATEESKIRANVR